MKDLSPDILPLLHSHQIPLINPGAGNLLPNYAGFSLANIPATICQLAGVPPFGIESLSPTITDHLEDHYDHIILILMDGVRYQFLQSHLNAPHWQQVLDNALISPLTSITPSTTSAALTSLWTGRTPAEHGILGYEVWLKEYGMIANMILHSAFTFQGDVGGLHRAGFDPLTFLPVPTLGPHLRSHGVDPFAIQNISIAFSGLSKMLFPGVEVLPYRSTIDLFVTLEQLLDSRRNQSTYAYIYWETIDSLSHHYGPDDERTYREFEHFSRALVDSLKRIRKTKNGKTLLLISADHGFVHTPIQSQYELSRFPQLLEQLVMVPTGENRLPYLFPKNGCGETLISMLKQQFGTDFLPIPSAVAIQQGLFGSGIHHPLLAERLGEWILVPQENAYLWWWPKANPLLGRHGGLSPQEMIIPFLAINV